VVDEPSAGERACGGRERRQPGPHADPARTVVDLQRPVEQREAGRDDKRGADPLHGAGGDQRVNRRRARAQNRRHAHDPHADHQRATAPEAVGERAGDQQQRRHRQQVARQRPLDRRDAGIEAATNRRDGDVDDVRVVRGDARSQHGPGDQRRAGRAA
jgi:hypothetical protein